MRIFSVFLATALAAILPASAAPEPMRLTLAAPIEKWDEAIPLGNGLLATGIGRIGRGAGKALAEKKAGATPPPAQAPNAAPAPAPAAAPAPAQLKGDDIGEIARMVRMTPGTEGERVEGRRRDRDGDRSDRFVRARR